MGLPTSNGWVLGGTNVATLIFKDSNYIQDLYTNGDESSSVTGGWSTSAFTYSSYGRTSPIKNTSYVTISSAWGPPESACCIGTVNTIDLTIYDRLYAEVEITDAGIGYIGTTNKLNFSMGAGDVPSYVGLSPYDVGTHIVSCDISGRDGNFYIVAYTWANASGQSSSFRMKRIWLENATKSVTVYGDVKPIKTAYADGARGAYFDGSGDYFTVPDSDDWYFTGDFCIEVDCLLNALPASGSGIAIFDQYGTADMYFFIRNTSGTYTLEFSNGATNQIWCKQTILLTGGERFKAKLSRSGNTYRMFKNNVQIGSDYTNATAHTNCTGVISIGSYNSSGGNYMNGYLLGMRVSKGISRIVETQPDQLTVDQYTVFCTNFDSVYDQYYCSALHSNVVDATGNGTGMAATGTTLVADSSFGNVRSLNGSSEYIAVTDNDYLYNFTGLIYFPEDITSTTTSRGLILPFDIGTSWLYLNNSTSSITGETISLYKDSGIRFTSTVVSMGWHVLTIRWNGSAYDFYLDGTLCVMGTYGAEVPLTIGGFILGQGSSPYFNGKFGTVTRAITPRSTEWVRTESQSLKNTLLTYGPSQTNNTMSFFWMNF
jgi:hypothetical protein